jgi:hypothetical protein
LDSDPDEMSFGKISQHLEVEREEQSVENAVTTANSDGLKILNLLKDCNFIRLKIVLKYKNAFRLDRQMESELVLEAIEQAKEDNTFKEKIKLVHNDLNDMEVVD